MSTSTIGKLAERTGFTTSALRYYERRGLLDPVGRNEAGYRLYDDAAEERLRFIARSKQLGCTLEEIVDLVSLLDQERCGPVQARLHELVSDKLMAADRRSDELRLLTSELREAASQLGQEPIDGPCDEACACQQTPEPPTASALAATGPQPVTFGRLGDEAADPVIACTLDDAEVPDRIGQWRELLSFVVDRRPLESGTGLRLAFDPAVPHGELLRLTTAEQGCCAFFSFAITIDHRGFALEVRAPDGAGDVVTSLFGPAEAG